MFKLIIAVIFMVNIISPVNAVIGSGVELKEKSVIDVIFQKIEKGLGEKDLSKVMKYFSADETELYREMEHRFTSLLQHKDSEINLRLQSSSCAGSSAEAIVFINSMYESNARRFRSAYWVTFQLHKIKEEWLITGQKTRDYAKPVHIDLDVELFPGKGFVEGTAAIDYEIEEPGETNLILTLNRGLEIKKLCDTRENDLQIDRVGRVGIIEFGHEFQRGDTGRLLVEFDGTFFNEAKERGYSQVGITPEGCFASWVTSWYPMIDCETSKCTGNLSYTVPEGLTVVSSGLKIDEDSRDGRSKFRFRVTNPLNFSFAAARYASLTKRIENIDIGAYFLGGDLRNATEYIETCSEMIQHFIDVYGFYPFDQYCIVEIPRKHTGTLGGSSEQGMNLFPEGMLPSDSMNEFVIAHEIGHSWWGNLIRGGIVQSEVMAQFTSTLWFEHRYGEKALRSLLNNGFNTTSSQFADTYLQMTAIAPEGDRTLGMYNSEDASIIHELADTKGHFVMHMLRDQIGRETFHQAIRDLLQGCGGQSITLTEFRRYFEKRSGDDLGWFFDQWFFRKGAPEFNFIHTVDKVPDGYEISGIIEQSGEFYRAHAEIGYQIQGQWDVVSVEIQESPQTFKFVISDTPDYVVFDPFQKLLRWRPELKRVKDIKAIATLNAVYQCEAAREKLDKVQSELPKSMKVMNLSGDIFVSSGQYDCAIEEFQKAISYHETLNTGIFTGDYLSALLKQGQSYDLAGQRDKAIELYQRVINYPVKHFSSISAAEQYMKSPFMKRKAYVVSREKLEEYTGEFAIEGLLFTIWLDDNGILKAKQPNSPPMSMYPLGPDEFGQVVDDTIRVKYNRNSEKVVDNLDVFRNGKLLVSLKKK